MKFAERSKIAWAIYDKDNSPTRLYMPKYHQKDNQEIDFGADPLRQFKLDRKKLVDIFGS